MHPSLSQSERLFIVKIAMHEGRNGSFPGNTKLALTCGVTSRRGVQKIANRLIEKGLIQRIAVGQGYKEASIYRICEDDPRYPSAKCAKPIVRTPTQRCANCSTELCELPPENVRTLQFATTSTTTKPTTKTRAQNPSASSSSPEQEQRRKLKAKEQRERKEAETRAETVAGMGPLERPPRICAQCGATGSWHMRAKRRGEVDHEFTELMQ